MDSTFVSRDEALRLLGTEELGQQLRVDVTDEIELIDDYLDQAVEMAEAYMGRGILTQTRRLVLDDFADVVPLPMAAPLQSITSVQYYASDGTLTTLSTAYYTTEETSEPARLVRKPNQVWPSLQSDRLARVIVTYVVGWDDVSDVPALIKQGVRLIVAAMFADREGGSVEMARALSTAQSCWALAGRVWDRPLVSV